MTVERDVMEYDVVIIGAGPSGLSAGIKLKQLALANNTEISVCILEKGAEIGAHILSGAVLEPRSLNELFPDWKKRNAPLNTPVKHDKFLFLSKDNQSYQLPTPPQMDNHGNYIISLGNFCRWLGEQAEELGVEIYAGFPASEIIYSEDGSQVLGVITGDMGVNKEGHPTDNYQAGVELRAKQTIFSEGCRGSLTKQLFDKFNLREEADPQTYAIGIKELWEIDPAKHRLGEVVHTIGYPLDTNTYGGTFLYHLENNQISVGMVVGLDYQNPHLSPFEEFQRFKLHPSVKAIFEGGRRIAYGARALSEGGFQSIPKLTFSGGLLIGDTAGFLNVPKIKGTHTSMKSGMVAAEAVFEHLSQEKTSPEVTSYTEKLENSWLWEELHAVRNIRPSFRWGLWGGLLYSAFDSLVLQGKAPWTLHHHEDHTQLKKASECEPIEYPKPDGVITFDRLSSVFISNTNHAEEQPCHLKLKDENTPISINLKDYDAPEQRYCPAGVYEIIRDENQQNPRLQINSQNCVHCKTCDIKDPTQNITWSVPQGGDGPNYPNM